MKNLFIGLILLTAVCMLHAEVTENFDTTISGNTGLLDSYGVDNVNLTPDSGIIWTAYTSTSDSGAGDDADISIDEDEGYTFIKIGKKANRYVTGTWVRGLLDEPLADSNGIDFYLAEATTVNLEIKYLARVDGTWYISDQQDACTVGEAPFLRQIRFSDTTWDQITNSAILDSTNDGQSAALVINDTNTTLTDPELTGGGIVLVTEVSKDGYLEIQAVTFNGTKPFNPQACCPDPADGAVLEVIDPNLTWTDGESDLLAVRVFSDIDGGGMVDISGIIAPGVESFGPITVAYDQVVNWKVCSYYDVAGNVLIEDGGGPVDWTFTGVPAITGMSPVDEEELDVRQVELSADFNADANSYIITFNDVDSPILTEPVFEPNPDGVDIDFDSTNTWSITAYSDAEATIQLGATGSATFYGPTLIEDIYPAQGDEIVGFREVLINWTAHEEAKLFQIFFDYADGTGFEKMGTTTDNEMLIPGLDWDGSYSYKIDFYDADSTPLGSSEIISFTTGPLSLVQDFTGFSDGIIYNGIETPPAGPLGYTWGGCTHPAGSTLIQYSTKTNAGLVTDYLSLAGNACLSGGYVYSVFDPNHIQTGDEFALESPTTATFTMFNSGNGAKPGDNGRLIIRDADSRWYLAKEINAQKLQSEIKQATQDCTFDITAQTWDEIIGNAAANMNAGGGASETIRKNSANLDTASNTPNLLSITGGGVMIETANATLKPREIAKITWLGGVIPEQPNAWQPNFNDETVEVGTSTVLSWNNANIGDVDEAELFVDYGSGFSPLSNKLAVSKNSLSQVDVVLPFGADISWKVVSYAGGEEVGGEEVWTFTTAACSTGDLNEKTQWVASGGATITDAAGLLMQVNLASGAVTYDYTSNGADPNDNTVYAAADFAVQEITGLTVEVASADGTLDLAINGNPVTALNGDAAGPLATMYFDLTYCAADMSDVSTISFSGSGLLYIGDIKLCASHCVSGLSFFDIDGDCTVGLAELVVAAHDWLRDPSIELNLVTAPVVDYATLELNTGLIGLYGLKFDDGDDIDENNTVINPDGTLTYYIPGDEATYTCGQIIEENGESVLQLIPDGQSGNAGNRPKMALKSDPWSGIGLPGTTDYTFVWKTALDSGYKFWIKGYTGNDSFVTGISDPWFRSGGEPPRQPEWYHYENVRLELLIDNDATNGQHIIISQNNTSSPIAGGVMVASELLGNLGPDYCQVDITIDADAKQVNWSVTQDGYARASGTETLYSYGDQGRPTGCNGGPLEKGKQGTSFKAITINRAVPLMVDFDSSNTSDMIDFAELASNWLLEDLWP